MTASEMAEKAMAGEEVKFCSECCSYFHITSSLVKWHISTCPSCMLPRLSKSSPSRFVAFESLPACAVEAA